MADMLRVTTPLNSGQDAATKVRPLSSEAQGNQGITNIVNPTRVNKGDGKTLYDDTETKYSPNLKSNFDTFLQKLNSTPGMANEMARLFFTKYGSMVNSGMSEGIAEEMAQFLEMMKVDDSQLLALLKGMQNSSVKFTGSFFDVLRGIINSNTASVDAKQIVLEFLRKYDAISGNRHNLQNIMSNLNNIADRMMKSSADQLRSEMQNINMLASKGDVEGNLNVLRNNIIPLLSKYISQTKDFGSVRDNISLFVLNFTRYEIGSKEGFSNALSSLLGLPEVASDVNNTMIAQLVDSIFAGRQSDRATALQHQLASILTRGVEGQAGAQNTQVFQNILQAQLLNESVYMPLLHMMLPVSYMGRQMFSEIWVDPDSNERQEKGGSPATKLFVKFDIRETGYFEMIMLIENNKVDMQLFYPESFESKKSDIRSTIMEILDRNDLKVRSYFADICVQPKPISEVFKKLYEGRNMINVTV